MKLETYQPPSYDYQGLELKPYDGRPGCNAALECPSRIGNYYYYRDGSLVIETPDLPKEQNVKLDMLI